MSIRSRAPILRLPHAVGALLLLLLSPLAVPAQEPPVPEPDSPESAAPEPGPGPDAPEECTLGRVSRIFIDNHSIFDVAAMDEDAPFRWAYRVANAVHMDTRAGFIRDELLFATGDCYDPFLLQETERTLRNHVFIAQSDVFGVPQPDGSWHVVVDTRDEWTTKLDVGITFDEGLNLEGVDLTEENLLGRGILAGFFFEERRQRQDAGIFFATPRLLGTRWDANFSIGRSRSGEFLTQGFTYPFVGEIGRVGVRQVYRFRESLFPYSTPREPSFDHILLPFEEEALEVTVAGRLGRPGNLTVFGAGILREEIGFPEFPGGVELSQRGDFSDTDSARIEHAQGLTGQIRDISVLRMNFLLGQRNVRFIQRRGLDALTGVQDIRVGSEFDVTVGRSLGDLGAGPRETPDDFYTRFHGFLGWAPAQWVISSEVTVEARHVLSRAEGSDGWKDILGEADLYVYRNSELRGRHTVFGRISASGGWSVTRPYQLTLGGRAGVRGYLEADFPGGRRVVATLEDRLFFDWPAPDLFDFGATLFADAGRAWAGDVPFGRDIGWKASVGAGLRFGFPSGSRNVVRADLALPVTDPGAFSSPVFRLTFIEVVGLRPGVADEEMLRSRRPQVGTDLLADEPR